MGWDFLRDEQNREALKLVGAAIAALVVAGWAVLQEIRTRRRLRDVVAEIEQIKGSQADILRTLERTERRHDLLFGVMVGKTAIQAEATPNDESAPDTNE
jgi:hypothetical protein